jgi:hypothetical protein
MNRFLKIYLYSTFVLYLFLTANEVSFEYFSTSQYRDPYTNPLVALANLISEPYLTIPILVAALFYTIGYTKFLDPNRKYSTLRNIVGLLIGLGIGYILLPGIIYFGHGVSYYVPLATILALLAYNTAMLVRRILDRHRFIRVLAWAGIPLLLLAPIFLWTHPLVGESADPTGCESYRIDTPERDAHHCYFKRALENPDDYEVCASLTVESRREACLGAYFQTAHTLKFGGIQYDVITVDNPRALCSLTRSENNSSLEEYCWTSYAGATKDVTLCGGNSSEKSKSSCYRTIALLENNPSFCEYIDSKEDKVACYRWVARNLSRADLCNAAPYTEQEYNSMMEDPYFGGGESSLCIMEIAEKLQDPSICNLMSELDRKHFPATMQDCVSRAINN